MPSNYHDFTLGRRTPRSSAADNHQWRLLTMKLQCSLFKSPVRLFPTILIVHVAILLYADREACWHSENACRHVALAVMPIVTNNASYYSPGADGHAQWEHDGSTVWMQLQCSLFSMTTVTLCKKDYNRFLIYTFLSYFIFVLSLWGGKLIFAKKTKTDF